MSSGSLKACLHPGEEGRKGRGCQECRKTITGAGLSPWIVTPQEVFSSALSDQTCAPSPEAEKMLSSLWSDACLMNWS